MQECGSRRSLFRGAHLYTIHTQTLLFIDFRELPNIRVIEIRKEQEICKYPLLYTVVYPITNSISSTTTTVARPPWEQCSWTECSQNIIIILLLLSNIISEQGLVVTHNQTHSGIAANKPLPIHYRGHPFFSHLTPLSRADQRTATQCLWGTLVY